MRVIAAVVTMFMGSQMAFGQADQGNGWQFYKFFGAYHVARQGGACSQLSGQVEVGFKYTHDFPSIEIKSLFSTDAPYFEYLRNLEMHGENCYECDPDWYESNVVGGDGINSATFKKSGVEPYDHKAYSTVIEMVRTADQRVFLKWNDCTAELLE